VDRLDEPLLPTPVADGTARRCQAARQRGLTDKSTGPQTLEEFLLGDDPVAVLNEISQHVEHLWLEFDEFTRIAQLVPW
jgi:hypothetical protein